MTSATCSRSRASSGSRPSPTTGRPTPSAAARSTSSPPTGRARRRASPGVGAAISDKIRELATTGRMAYYDRLRAEIPPTLVEIMHIPGVGPKTVQQLHEQLGIESLEDLKRAAEAGTPPRPARDVVPDRAARPRGDRPPRGEPQAHAAQPRRGVDRGHRRGPRGAPGRAVGRAGRVVPPQEGDDRRPRPARRDRRTGPRARHVHRSRRRGPDPQPWPVQGCGPPAARAAGRPHGHAARRGRHVPHPLHGFEGAQRQAARPCPRSRLEPVREGLPAHRRERRAADRRRGRAAHVPDRAGGLRLPRPAVHRARAARGRGRDRGGAGGPAAAPRRARRSARRPAHPFGVVRRRPVHRGHGRGRPPAGIRLPGPDRPLDLAGDRARPRARSRRAAALDHRRAQRAVRAGGARRARLPRRRRPKASACCTAASWRSGPTGNSTTPTSCSPGSTSWWRRSTSGAASHATS